MNPDVRTRLLATFRVEAEEHLQAVTANLLALARGVGPAEMREVVEATFREVHTLKGAARSVSLREIETLSQACESVLSRLTRGELPLTRALVEGLQEAADLVGRLLAGGEGGVAVGDVVGRLERATRASAGDGAEPTETPRRTETPRHGEPRKAPVAPAALTIDTIRLATARLDALLLQAEDLLIPKLAVGERVEDARALVGRMARCREAVDRVPAAGKGRGNGAAAEVGADLLAEAKAVEALAGELLRRLVRDQRTVASAVDGLLDEMRRMRLTPASAVLDLFPRMVRDLAREQGKDVEWAAHGQDIEADRKVLEAMKEPLIHLVRNAIDHGIEPPETRVQAGKPPAGHVLVSVAAVEGSRIEIRVEDDGGGIDLSRVREAAARARLLTGEQAQALPDDAALELIFRSGLSTSPIITDLSGHGLGMAIVKERVERLGGQIRLESRPGAGTSVRMILPATVATFRGLLVRAGSQPFLLPIEAVERTIRVSPETVERVEGREAIRWDGHVLPVARLGAVLDLAEPAEPPEASPRQPCVVVRAGEARAGFLVGEVVGDREVLVKELRPPLVRVRNVSGAGLLGTGQVVLILRPADLLRSMRQAPRRTVTPAAPAGTRRQPTILVVDDSITTRTMEKNLLEGAGYQVRVAVDGVEAWTALRSERFDLLVSDVDMPRMDGFELTARVRGDRKLADLPVVLVTALDSREDKERGIEVGANAYVIKSSFDQSNLLEIIRRLV